MAEELARQVFHGRLSNLHNKDDLTDFVIICGDRRWGVHRLVLALHSDVLGKACSNGFKVNQIRIYTSWASLTARQESREATVDLSADHQPEEIEALIEYMYTFNYSPGPLGQSELVELHINMAVLADKYNIKGLQQLATDAFRLVLPDTAVSLAFAASRAYAAPIATKEICEAICAAVAKRTELLDNEEGKSLVQVMEENGSFAVDVARKIAAARQSPTAKPRNVSTLTTKLCRNCHHAQQVQGEPWQVTCDNCNTSRIWSQWPRL